MVRNANGEVRHEAHPWLWRFLVLAMVGVSVTGMVKSWTTLSATFDEPYHIASGMEWLDKGTYTYELQHPPLARVVIALVPYLGGLRSSGLVDPKDEGYSILYSTGNYQYNLAAARSGNQIFFLTACLFVYLWARRWFSEAAALWAVLLFASTPPILAHAGLATLDMACAATVAAALYAFVLCLESATWPRVVLLGVALGCAFLCKFSSIAFLGSCFFGAIVYLMVRTRDFVPNAARWRRLAVQVLVVGAILFTLVWGGYRFEVGRLSGHGGEHPGLDRAFGNAPVVRDAAYRIVEARFPLAQFARGIDDVKLHNGFGHDSYLLGAYRDTGWWYFFPVVVGVKTPIGLLILVACGIFAIFRRFGQGHWQRELALIFPLAIMLVCVNSRIDLGVRHILPIYPMMAVIGGYAVSELFILAKHRSAAILALPVLLVGWTVADSWMIRPDYLAYFNQFARSHPERILAESDLDWGQDLYRLSRRLKELQVDHVSLKYFGTAPLQKADLPPYSVLSDSASPTRGYVAVSVRYLTLEYAKNGSFAWLKPIPPREIIGKSIYLYNFGQ